MVAPGGLSRHELLNLASLDLEPPRWKNDFALRAKHECDEEFFFVVKFLKQYNYSIKSSAHKKFERSWIIKNDKRLCTCKCCCKELVN